MRLFSVANLFSRRPSRPSRFAHWSVRQKLVAAIFPTVLGVLVLSGGLLIHSTERFVGLAVERVTLLSTLAQANAVATLLETSARLAERAMVRDGSGSRHEAVRQLLRDARIVLGPGVVVEAALAAPVPQESFLAVCDGHGEIADVPLRLAAHVRNGPLPLDARGMVPGERRWLGAMDVVYPVELRGSDDRPLRWEVVRWAMGLEDGAVLVVGIRLQAIRNLLGSFHGPHSPLAGFTRTPGLRFSLFVDPQGWMYFEAKAETPPEAPLDVDDVRQSFQGVQSKNALEVAFRPLPEYESYWRIIADLQEGGHGVMRSLSAKGTGGGSGPTVVGYAPVRFASRRDNPGQVVAAVVYVDRSLLMARAGQQQLWLMMAVGVVTVVVLLLVLWALGAFITRPLFRLVEDVRTALLQENGALPAEPIMDRETALLRQAIADLVCRLRDREAEIVHRDQAMAALQAREPFVLDVPSGEGMGVGLVGTSPAVERLRGRITKAAASDADVLIVGETGTGKELVAHAIHACSHRADGPYLTINCGALDENLLMDALFGHVKGAFSEAKGERQGAFLAASGGTLLLDELGNASMRVQQALLRALSARKIQPLGSDREIPFDTRVIAATNANLEDMVRQGTFREDLYFRLQVLTIATPPLRQRKEDIPLLATHFLRLAFADRGRPPALLSRGAVAKLMAYDWPGNIRELKNCILRAAAFIEGGVIQAEDLHLGNQGHESRGEQSTSDVVTVPQPQKTVRRREVLTPRQQRGLEFLRIHGTMTRQQYEGLFEERIAPRTALYDLKELVRKGYAVLEGKGPAARYILVDIPDNANNGVVPDVGYSS